jgi:hypothetical protein
MRALSLTLALIVAGAPVVSGQQGQMRQRQMLQQQVMQRYMQNYKQQAGLNDKQFQDFTQLTERAFNERRELQQRERVLWQALEGQMKPGVAADADSLVGLIDAIFDVQQELIETERRNQADMAEFLTPVQRAQLMLSQRRLQNSIQNVMRNRQQNMEGGGGR